MIFVHAPVLKIKDLTTKSSATFENTLKSYNDKDNISFTVDGRNALYLILKSMNLKKTDEVILPAFTCRAVRAATEAVCTPVYADVLDDTFCISPKEVKSKITKKTKAVVAVHSFGNPCAINNISKICKDADVSLIEDCAQSLGATYNDKPVGSFGDYSFFSFRFSKDITSFTGGAALSNSKLIKYEATTSKYSAFAKLGLVKTASYFPNYSKKAYKYIFGAKESQTFSANEETLSAFQRSCLQNQFNAFEKIVDIRRTNAEIYNSLLKKVQLIKSEKEAKNSYYRYPILSKNRSELIAKLTSEGIETEVMYPYALDDCKVASRLSREVLNIPVNQKVSEVDLQKIITTINDF